MLTTRIIPTLLLKKRGFYKGIKFKKHQYVGDPINTIRIFNEKEVDELVILDIEASKLNKSIDFEFLEDVVSEAFMPVGYGGGIKNVEDAKKLFSIGIEKVILNTNALLDLNLIKEIVNIFGSQSVVFSLDIKKNIFGKKCVYIKSASQKVKDTPIDIALQMQALGVGEIMLNNIDRDGTFQGYDLDLIQEVSSKLSIPLIASGGAKDLNDFKLAKENGAHACAAGAMFIYHMPHRAVIISYPKYEDIRKILGE